MLLVQLARYAAKRLKCLELSNTHLASLLPLPSPAIFSLRYDLYPEKGSIKSYS